MVRDEPEASTKHPPAAAASQPPLWLVAAAFAALYFFWGSTYLGIKWSVLDGMDETPPRGFPPFLLAGIRSVIAGAMVYAYVRLRRGEARPTARQWINTTIIGTLLLGGGNGMVTFAIQHIASGIVALMVSLLPIWMLLLEGFWGGPPLRERVRPALLLGIAMGFGGVALLMWPRLAAAMATGGAGDGRDHFMEALGIAALLLSSLCWANGSLFSRRLSAAGDSGLPRSPFLATGMQLLTGGAVLLIAGAMRGEFAEYSTDAAFGSPRPLLALIYLITFGSIVGYSAYIWLLGVSTPAKIATYAYVNPIVAILLGAALGGERLTGRTLAAAAVIIAGVVVIVTFRAKKPPIAAEEPAPVPGTGGASGPAVESGPA